MIAQDCSWSEQNIALSTGSLTLESMLLTAMLCCFWRKGRRNDPQDVFLLLFQLLLLCYSHRWVLYFIYFIPFCHWAIPWRLFIASRSVTKWFRSVDMELWCLWLSENDPSWKLGSKQHNVWIFHCPTLIIGPPHHFRVNYFKINNDQVTVRLNL